MEKLIHTEDFGLVIALDEIIHLLNVCFSAAMYKHNHEENHIINHLYMIENGNAILKDKNNQLVGGMAWSLNNNHLYSSDLVTGVIYDYQILKCILPCN